LLSIYTAINTAAGDAGTARQLKGLEGFIAVSGSSYAAYNAGNDFSEQKLMEMFKDATRPAASRASSW
jgi:hypothetical protein